MPLLMAAVISLIVLIGLPELLEKKPVPKDVWEASIAIGVLYPILGALLTIVLTKPYYEAFKLMLPFRQPRNESDVAIIKF